MTNKEKFEKLATEITNKVIEQMEKGIIPWRKPFKTIDGRHNSYSTKESYSLLNQILLDVQTDENDTRDYIEYATFNAIKKAGGKVNKGAKAKILYEAFITIGIKEDANGEPLTDANGEKETFPIYHSKKILVFDIEKDTNLKINKPERTRENKIIKEPEIIINNYIEREKIEISHKPERAYYSPSTDTVNIPDINSFKNNNFYYGVFFHELIHSTGSLKRLNRLNKKASFGSDEYSKEELVAEIGSYTIINHLGLSTEQTEKNNVAYIQSWIRALKNDTTLFAKATQQATKAVKYILNIEKSINNNK